MLNVWAHAKQLYIHYEVCCSSDQVVGGLFMCIPGSPYCVPIIITPLNMRTIIVMGTVQWGGVGVGGHCRNQE